MECCVNRGDFFADEAEEEEPEEVRQAWEELILIQKEQDRYAGIKLDLEQDLKEVRKTASKLEDVSAQCCNAAYSLYIYYISNSFWSWRAASHVISHAAARPRAG